MFGLAFTIVLNVLHSNYGKHHETLLEYVVSLENQPLARSEDLIGPWTAYKTQRDARFEKRIYRVLIWYGPVLLLVLSMTAALLYSVIEFFHYG